MVLLNGKLPAQNIDYELGELGRGGLILAKNVALTFFCTKHSDCIRISWTKVSELSCLKEDRWLKFLQSVESILRQKLSSFPHSWKKVRLWSHMTNIKKTKKSNA